MDNFNYLNFLPENSRRLRALPVWFTLKAYGKKGYQEIVDNSIHLTQQLGQFIEQNNHLELLAPVLEIPVILTTQFQFKLTT